MRLGVGAALVEGRLVGGDLEIEGGRVAAVGLSSSGSKVAAPGFVELQVNGFGGVDFASARPEDYRQAGEALLRTGVTAYRPTLITAPIHRLLQALAVVGEAMAGLDGPHLLGVHLEGPFLSPSRAGTHPVEFLLDPDVELLARLLDGGPVRHLTLAPELPGALELVDLAVGRGVTVGLGHSDADAAFARAAVDRGAVAVTHVFNAMRPFTHRDPGLVGVALTHPGVTCQIIADQVHLAPETILLAWQAAGNRLAVTTDAVEAATLGDGRYVLGTVEVEVQGAEVRRADGTLAGSVLTMDRALRNLVEIGIPLEGALQAVSEIPGRLAGGGHGRLQVGGRADLVVLDEQLQVERVMLAGKDVL